MENEPAAEAANIASTDDFDFDLIWEYFIEFERQGPGSPEVTIKALSFTSGYTNAYTDESRIADLGCGTGGQTMVLVHNTKGTITALNLSPAAVNKLNETVKKLRLQNRVKGINGSMDNLSFNNDEFDLIWSEGAIDSIGFEKGINHWKSFLKKGGHIAVSNLAWFTDERPAELEKFYLEAVPDMGTVGNSISIMQKAGFSLVAAFALPDNCWTDNYYTPQAAVNEMFLKKYAGNKTVEDFIASCKYEEELYSKYKQYFGYMFYIGKKL
jgi:ubiquinone/menaquinone biosynthesis C-methylase UbiE